jgi:hypothetical protein
MVNIILKNINIDVVVNNNIIDLVVDDVVVNNDDPDTDSEDAWYG